MMVKIHKGRLALTIPAGAVRKYTLAGWELSENSKSDEATEEVSVNEDDTDSEAISEEEEEDIEYVDPAELAKKPIDELDRDELKILAEYKGIDISGITSTKKLRAALRDME